MTASLALLDDCATVWTTPAGSPVRFLYRGRRFVVTRRPVFWIDRLPWWEQRGPLAGIDQPMWQVVAADEAGETTTFDLAADPDSNQWRVTGAYGPTSEPQSRPGLQPVPETRPAPGPRSGSGPSTSGSRPV